MSPSRSGEKWPNPNRLELAESTRSRSRAKKQNAENQPESENIKTSRVATTLSIVAFSVFASSSYAAEIREDISNFFLGEFNEEVSAYLSANLSGVTVEAGIDATAEMQWILRQSDPSLPNLYPPLKLIDESGNEEIRHPRMSFEIDDGATAVFYVVTREGELQPVTVRERSGDLDVHVDLGALQLGAAYYLPDGTQVTYEKLDFTKSINSDILAQALSDLSTAQDDPGTMSGVVEEFQNVVSGELAGELSAMSKLTGYEKKLQDSAKEAITRAIDEQIRSSDIGLTSWDPESDISVSFSGDLQIFAPDNPDISNWVDFPGDSVEISGFEVATPIEEVE